MLIVLLVIEKLLFHLNRVWIWKLLEYIVRWPRKRLLFLDIRLYIFICICELWTAKLCPYIYSTNYADTFLGQGPPQRKWPLLSRVGRR